MSGYFVVASEANVLAQVPLADLWWRRWPRLRRRIWAADPARWSASVFPFGSMFVTLRETWAWAAFASMGWTTATSASFRWTGAALSSVTLTIAIMVTISVTTWAWTPATATTMTLTLFAGGVGKKILNSVPTTFGSSDKTRLRVYELVKVNVGCGVVVRLKVLVHLGYRRLMLLLSRPVLMPVRSAGFALPPPTWSGMSFRGWRWRVVLRL